jgi:phenylacetate-coenzyme A ligase PaaK-like adenylate-forming protein
MRNLELENRIFNCNSSKDFNTLAIEIFQFQYKNCSVYSQYVKALHINPDLITHYSQIPFLPISFFKSHEVVSVSNETSTIFESSKTTGQIASKHIVSHIEIYEESFLKNFENVYSNPKDFVILALLPSYLERENSSLAYMASKLISLSENSESGFYLSDFEKLFTTIERNKDKKILLLGVSFALLDFVEQFSGNFPNIIIMETGGMKGRKKEMTRAEVHEILQKSFSVSYIHSEYGMTELLSQAYSKGNGIFETPQWMRVLIRDIYDPFTYISENKLGGINIIDLANLYSCSFIETQDVGKIINTNNFTIEGRFDSSDIRGCNLMYQ